MASGGLFTGDDPGEEPSAKAHLIIALIPPGEKETPENQATSRLATFMRRVRIGLGFSVIVPPRDAGDLIRMIRNVGLALTWAVTVITSVAVMFSVDTPARVIITVLALELVGFTVSAMSVRRKR